MSPKNVNASIPDEDMAEIRQSIDAINAKLPFLISMTADERRACMKLGDKSVSFVDKVIGYSETNSNMVPAYLDVTRLKSDYQLSRVLTEALRLLHPLVQNIEDTATEAGVEALSGAMIFYNAVKAAAKTGVPGAKSIYEDLQKRFPGAGGGRPAADSPEIPPQV
ncbi:MAG: hypothetical protein WCM76_14915 [Bacteroidota bacterium]